LEPLGWRLSADRTSVQVHGKPDIRGECGTSVFAIIPEQRDAATGKRKWHSFQRTKRQAQIECARLISEIAGGTYLEPNKTTLAQFFERWLNHVKSQVTPTSHERYAGIVNQNLIPSIGSVHLSKLRPAQISTAYSNALATGRRTARAGFLPGRLDTCTGF
jgi:hypothetical protein